MHFKHILPMKSCCIWIFEGATNLRKLSPLSLCTFLKIVLFIYYKTGKGCRLKNLFKNQNIWLVVTFMLGQDDQGGRN